MTEGMYVSCGSFSSIFEINVHKGVCHKKYQRKHLVQIRPVLFGRLSMFFLRQSLLVSYVLLLSIPSRPIGITRQRTRQIRSNDPAKRINVFQNFLMCHSHNTFRLIRSLTRVPKVQGLSGCVRIIRGNVNNVCTTAFPYGGPYRPLRRRSFSHYQGHRLTSFNGRSRVM